MTTNDLRIVSAKTIIKSNMTKRDDFEEATENLLLMYPKSRSSTTLYYILTIIQDRDERGRGNCDCECSGEDGHSGHGGYNHNIGKGKRIGVALQHHNRWEYVALSIEQED